MNSKLRILFVDDDELILSCYERLLGRHFSVETALGSAAAIEALKRGTFAVVASDIRMPGMNGIDLLRKVRETSPDTVGVLLSGNPELEGEGGAGCEDLIFRVVAKPCPTADLIVVIDEALERYRMNTLAGCR